MKKHETNELKRVFEENVSSHWVPWERALDDFIDYACSLRESGLSENFIACELCRCTGLLMTKKIDPNAIATSFTLKDNMER